MIRSSMWKNGNTMYITCKLVPSAHSLDFFIFFFVSCQNFFSCLIALGFSSTTCDKITCNRVVCVYWLPSNVIFTNLFACSLFLLFIIHFIKSRESFFYLIYMTCWWYWNDKCKVEVCVHFGFFWTDSLKIIFMMLYDEVAGKFLDKKTVSCLPKSCKKILESDKTLQKYPLGNYHLLIFLIHLARAHL